jgi:hypothetical protein
LGDPEPGAGPRAPVPPLMDPSKKVGQLNSVPVIALLDPFDFPVPISASDVVVFGSVRALTAPAHCTLVVRREIPNGGGYLFLEWCWAGRFHRMILFLPVLLDPHSWVQRWCVQWGIRMMLR